MNAQQDTHRLHFLLETVEREGRHLVFTSRRLLGQPIDSDWVEALQDNPDLAERLDAFVARFAHMQDTIGDRVIPQLRKCMLETPEAAFDNLNRMEKLGLLSSVTDWVEARNLRNRLIHEYMRDPQGKGRGQVLNCHLAAREMQLWSRAYACWWLRPLAAGWVTWSLVRTHNLQ